MRHQAGTDPRDVVAAKRDGGEVPPDELRAFVLGYSRGEIPDYLAAAFLMAAYINGLSSGETTALTRAMIDSGTSLPLAGVSRPKVDKHSTGGVSDGVTLSFAPLAAALGLAVAKLSGRGLGHTGGTLDKLESIPGVRTDLSPRALERQVDEVGCAVASRSADLTVRFAAEALVSLSGGGLEGARAEADRAMTSGAAAEVFARMVAAQGGDPRVVEDPWAVLPRAPVRSEIVSPTGGWLAAV